MGDGSQNFAASMLPWHDFYLLVGTASATLVGLMFVALSLGVGLRKRTKGDIENFVTPTVVYFIGVLLISALTVVPLDDARVVGGLLVTVLLANLPMGVHRFRRLQEHHEGEAIPIANWIWQLVVPALAQAVLGAAAIGMFAHDPRVAFGLAIGVTALLLAAVRNAWVLLVWIIEQRSSEVDPGATARNEDAPERRSDLRLG